MNKELSISIEDIKEELKKSAEELVKNEVKTQFVTWIGEKALYSCLDMDLMMNKIIEI